MKFRYNEKVRIRAGFYKGYKGRVISFKETNEKDKWGLFPLIVYGVRIMIDEVEQIKEIKEAELEKVLF
jgi:ribosomal protein L24